jgi:hypothetical protein
MPRRSDRREKRFGIILQGTQVRFSLCLAMTVSVWKSRPESTSVNPLNGLCWNDSLSMLAVGECWMSEPEQGATV